LVRQLLEPNEKRLDIGVQERRECGASRMHIFTQMVNLLLLLHLRAIVWAGGNDAASCSNSHATAVNNQQDDFLGTRSVYRSPQTIHAWWRKLKEGRDYNDVGHVGDTKIHIAKIIVHDQASVVESQNKRGRTSSGYHVY
jgi:hypothetical protein